MKIRDPKALFVSPEKLIVARGLMAPAAAARDLGISPQHLHRIESGGQRCPAHILLRMLIVYKINDPLSLAGEQKNLAMA